MLDNLQVAEQSTLFTMSLAYKPICTYILVSIDLSFALIGVIYVNLIDAGENK